MGSHTRIEMEGQTIGQWTVLGPARQSSSGNWYWYCRCSCGNIKEVEGSSLRKGGTSKCQRCSSRTNGRVGLYKRHADAPVYFVRCGDYVKIGASYNIERRVRDLESSNPYTIELLDIDSNEERWHKVFEHRHHRGEWYHFPVGAM